MRLSVEAVLLWRPVLASVMSFVTLDRFVISDPQHLLYHNYYVVSTPTHLYMSHDFQYATALGDALL